jgi:transposase, IS5 family
MKQTTLNLDLHCKKTRKREFLQEMEQVVPWAELVSLIAPYYPEGRNGRPPFALESMLRIHFMQRSFDVGPPISRPIFSRTVH